MTPTLVWLSSAWLASGRPTHFKQLAEPLLIALLSYACLPCGAMLSRGVAAFPVRVIGAAIDDAYRVELPRRSSGKTVVATPSTAASSPWPEYGGGAGSAPSGRVCGPSVNTWQSVQAGGSRPRQVEA